MWVCERNHELKRTSVWDSEGRCINQVLGPTVYPVYELPTEFLTLPFPGMKHAADAVFTDRHGNAITLDEFVVSMRPDGHVNWRYKNRWPGLHAGHSTSARGDEPGVLIAPTRFMGSGYVNEAIGEVLCISGNLRVNVSVLRGGLLHRPSVP